MAGTSSRHSELSETQTHVVPNLREVLMRSFAKNLAKNLDDCDLRLIIYDEY